MRLRKYWCDNNVLFHFSQDEITAAAICACAGKRPFGDPTISSYDVVGVAPLSIREGSKHLSNGELYGKGSGVPKNPEEAVALFRKAAAQQNIRAYVDLGYSYEKGFGLPQDLRLAGESYRKAKGNPQAEAGLKRLGAAANQ